MIIQNLIINKKSPKIINLSDMNNIDFNQLNHEFRKKLKFV